MKCCDLVLYCNVCHPAILCRSILEVCVANYVEHLIHTILGLDMLYPFLYHCGTVTYDR